MGAWQRKREACTQPHMSGDSACGASCRPGGLTLLSTRFSASPDHPTLSPILSAPPRRCGFLAGCPLAQPGKQPGDPASSGGEAARCFPEAPGTRGQQPAWRRLSSIATQTPILAKAMVEAPREELEIASELGLFFFFFKWHMGEGLNVSKIM